ncbi:MAG: hypothetical protein ACI9MR_003140, partial [Myxococcota bacterium]
SSAARSLARVQASGPTGYVKRATGGLRVYADPNCDGSRGDLMAAGAMRTRKTPSKCLQYRLPASSLPRGGCYSGHHRT